VTAAEGGARSFDPRATIARLVPGLLIAIVVAAVARLVSGALPSAISEVTIAVLLGILVAQTAPGRSATLRPGIAFSAQRVLRLGIVLLGARLSVDQILRIGLPAALVIAVVMACALGLVLGLSRLADVEPRLAVLLAVGAAVCGNSAVVATAPVIGARGRDVAYAVAVVTLFGTCAVFAYPAIGHALGLNDASFGLWSGTAINDTSQVVAASAAYSPGALEVATVVKLIRNALMAPLLIGIAWSWARTAASADGAAGDTSAGIRKAVPLFVLGFLAMAALRSIGVIGPDLAALLDTLARICILIALAAVGLSVRVGELRQTGPRALSVGFAAAIVIGVGTLAAIVAFGLADGLVV
jgi:uncharacterized integral membrane protein (TIGR00698 family)